jgi:hypothetical protein
LMPSSSLNVGNPPMPPCTILSKATAHSFRIDIKILCLIVRSETYMTMVRLIYHYGQAYISLWSGIFESSCCFPTSHTTRTLKHLLFLQYTLLSETTAALDFSHCHNCVDTFLLSRCFVKWGSCFKHFLPLVPYPDLTGEAVCRRGGPKLCCCSSLLLFALQAVLHFYTVWYCAALLYLLILCCTSTFWCCAALLPFGVVLHFYTFWYCAAPSPFGIVLHLYLLVLCCTSLPFSVVLHLYLLILCCTSTFRCCAAPLFLAFSCVWRVRLLMK